MKHLLFGFFIGILILFATQSCRKVKFDESSNAFLTFSKDTLHFDTVFNGIGSATRYFIVYNKNDLPIKISDIRLLSGENSNFRINVNGTAAREFFDVEINGDDSIFIFADVTIDPQNDDVIEYDQIRFSTNGNEQIIHMLAYGQDIHLINDSVLETQTWTNDKPYVIYNSAAVDENEVLTIEQGTHIYSHRNSRIIVLGTLIVDGSFEEPVIFEGDRLNGNSSIFFENDSLDNYDDVAGQWEGIILANISTNNHVENAIIKNAVTGIQVGSLGDENFTSLTLHNTRIEHHSYAGIFAISSTLLATNCLISDCGYYSVLLTTGGNYNFYNSTIGNYWRGIRSKPALLISNYLNYENTIYLGDLQNAYFGNSIIWGSNDNEIVIEEYADVSTEFNYFFENSILRINSENEIDSENENHFKNILLNVDPLFKEPYSYDFNLTENSPAINAASSEIVNTYPSLLFLDLNNNLRLTDDNPDIGAYELQ